MPVFEIEANGKTYEVDATDQARALSAFRSFNGGQSQAGQEFAQAASQASQKLQGTVSTRNQQGGFMDPVRQGLTFGFADEIDGLKGGVGAMLQGQDFGQGYQRGETDARARLEDYRQRHPIASTALEIGGAVIPAIATGGAGLAAKGATMGARAATGLATGAAHGAIYGAGAADGDLNDRVGGAAFGGMAGGAVGAIAPAIGNKVANAFQRFNQGRILNAAAKSAETSGAMKQTASALFDQADNANIMIQRPAFQRLYDGVRGATAKGKGDQNSRT